MPPSSLSTILFTRISSHSNCSQNFSGFQIFKIFPSFSNCILFEEENKSRIVRKMNCSLIRTGNLYLPKDKLFWKFYCNRIIVTENTARKIIFIIAVFRYTIFCFILNINALANFSVIKRERKASAIIKYNEFLKMAYLITWSQKRRQNGPNVSTN